MKSATINCAVRTCSEAPEWSYRLGTSYDAQGNSRPLVAFSLCRGHLGAANIPMAHCLIPQCDELPMHRIVVLGVGRSRPESAVPLCSHHTRIVTQADTHTRLLAP